MNWNCIVCGSPTSSHHISTTDGGEQYCCHSCWQRRTDSDVRAALATYSVLPGEVLDDVVEGFRSSSTELVLDGRLPELPDNQTIESREGPGGEFFELAGAELQEEHIEFNGPFAGVMTELELPREPSEPICAMLGYVKSGGERERVYVAWLCLGETPDQLGTAVGRMAAVLRGETDV